MNPKLVRAFTVGAIAVGASTIAHAQQTSSASQKVDLGKYYYESHCAICHGSSGTGLPPDPGWSLLIKDIPNLTTLSKRNGGVFPFERVYDTIDGRNEVRAHGPRDMPVWGRVFSAQSLDLSPYYDREAFARAKILALTEYVYRLQGK
jgi:mono/diheme cytochrome c family protein